MNTSNPALRPDSFTGGTSSLATARMTVGGTVWKTVTLLLLATASAAFAWTHTAAGFAGPLPIVGALGGFVVAMIVCFKKEWAPVLAPVYALLEGLFLGGISAVYAAKFGGIVFQAVALTFGTLFALMAAYQSGLIRPTQKFRLGIVAATGGICLVYVISMLLGIFGVHIPGIFGNGIVGIGFSVVVVVIAALNLILDFEVIEQGAAGGAPKYFEWYAAFGLMVTLVWLYLEILRLLSKLRSR